MMSADELLNLLATNLARDIMLSVELKNYSQAETLLCVYSKLVQARKGELHERDDRQGT